MDFTGTWHVHEMEMWDEEYFNMEVQAFIRIDSRGQGEFQFGLVVGVFHGKIVEYPHDLRFEFIWEGADEGEPDFGSGWIKLKNKDTLEGEFRSHNSDDSTFLARRAK